MTKQILEVGLALLVRADRWLVARRALHVHLGGLWEFPGGKRLPDETLAQTAIRELLEECDVHATALQVLDPIMHEYEDRIVHLTPVLCRWQGGEPRPLGAAACQWVSLDELRRLDMPPPNAAIIAAALRALAPDEDRG
jgi:8-oxo-dGTP diphosphatase